eukprot:3180654-Ditylum_brightwellii.AAC.1
MTTVLGHGPNKKWYKLIAAVYSIGQGATNGPSGWMFISDIILKCYSNLAVRHKLLNPTNDIRNVCGQQPIDARKRQAQYRGKQTDVAH